jgi:DNA recombination protein RmuC
MPEPILIAVVCAVAFAAGALIVWFTRPKAPAVDPVAEAAKLEEAQRNAEAFSNLNTRLTDMAHWLQGAHGKLEQTVNQRLDTVTQNLGVSLQTTTKHTTEHLQKLHERLAVIDGAQKNITELAAQVNSLQGVLANKQSRGAFGQGQLEAIIADVLPKGAYEFQHTLKNRTRPDCVIFMPNAGPLVIDAKFPLEAMTAWRAAATDDERKQAIARVRTDIGKHIADIAEKYLVPGETQDVALMFIPSESIYADLHERFDDMVQRAQRARVMIVSPTLMVLAIQVIRQMRKDAEMREAADQIRTEVGLMMKDVGLLGDRVNKLKGHFGQATKDIDDILISAGKVTKRGTRIEEMDFDEADALAAPASRTPRIEAAE